MEVILLLRLGLRLGTIPINEGHPGISWQHKHHEGYKNSYSPARVGGCFFKPCNLSFCKLPCIFFYFFNCFVDKEDFSFNNNQIIPCNLLFATHSNACMEINFPLPLINLPASFHLPSGLFFCTIHSRGISRLIFFILKSLSIFFPD